MSTDILRQQLEASLALTQPTPAEAQAKLAELKRDPDWVRRVLRGEPEARGEYDRLIVAMNPQDFVAPEQPKTASEMMIAAGLRYDGPIPQEVMNAIREQERLEARR